MSDGKSTVNGTPNPNSGPVSRAEQAAAAKSVSSPAAKSGSSSAAAPALPASRPVATAANAVPGTESGAASGAAPRAAQSSPSSLSSQLAWALEKIAREQGAVVDSLQLSAAFTGASTEVDPSRLQQVTSRLGMAPPRELRVPDRAHLPLLAFMGRDGWVVVTDREPDGAWRVVNAETSWRVPATSLTGNCYRLRFESSVSEMKAPTQATSFAQVLSVSMKRFRGSIGEAVVASIFIGMLALGTSLFSMQVYDRVIPTQGHYTLIVLSVGVLLSILIEFFMKHARSQVMDHVAVGLDGRLTREVFHRLLQLRVDQVPSSVGSLAGQLRGYEQVRGFYTASSLFALVDVPMALFFMAVIMLIASPIVALVPLAAAVLAFGTGLLLRRRITRLAAEGAQLSNKKTGLLVEAVEGVETVKAGSGGWKQLQRWIELNAITIHNDLRLRKASDGINHIAGAIQQVSYAGVVIAGAFVVMKGDMTMGALIACSILSGRILSPVMMLPNLMVQHAHAKAAVDSLDALYQLKTDNDGVKRVLLPSELRGAYTLERVAFAYDKYAPGMAVANLKIRPGERIGVVGGIGSGKSTLLRLLSGLYHPSDGRILLDGLDLSHISREIVNRHVGYLQQDHRLFQGTLRDNLLIGMPDPGDDVLMAAMHSTGMDQFVRSHPQGLERTIAEGGKGLSGGQRQLLAFTRLVLTNPSILLLDEPTAHMDQEQERRCLGVLSRMAAERNRTLVVVTHRPSLLPLVNRLIVVTNNRILLDGPRDEILAKLASAAAVEAAIGTRPAGPTSNPPVNPPPPSNTSAELAA